MQLLATYVVLLFTVQLGCLLHGISFFWFSGLWLVLLLLSPLYARRYLPAADHPHYAARLNILVMLFVSLLFLLLSGWFIHYKLVQHEWKWKESPFHAYVMSEVELNGRIVSTLEVDGNRIRFDLQVERIEGEPLEDSETVRLTRYAATLDELEHWEKVRRGNQWQGSVQLSYPSSQRNPGAFDYRSFLRQQGIYFTGKVKNSEWMTDDAELRSVDTVLSLIDRLRDIWREQVYQLFTSETAALIVAMTIGERSELSVELLERYQELGIVHLLAISGLHVGILFSTLYWLLTRFPVPIERVYTILIGIIPLYMLVSGTQVSVMRSGLMTILGLVLLRLRQTRHALLVLYAVYLLMLFLDPYWIMSIGFQLSFFVTFLLLTAFTPLSQFLQHFKMPPILASFLSVSILAQFASLPFLLYHFHSFSPYSLLINLLIVPLFSVFMIPAAFFIPLISYLHPGVVQLSVWVFERILQFVHHLLDFVAELPYAYLHTGPPPVWWLILYAGVLLVLLKWIENKPVRNVWLSVSCVPLLIGVLLVKPYFDSQAYVMVLDVGQGETTIIELPYRQEVVLIDLGGNTRIEQEEWKKGKKNFEVGQDVLLPYLRYRGINKIDKIIISHGHYDHFGGIQGILGKIKIEQLIRSPVSPHSDFEEEWLKKVAEHGIPIHMVSRGARWERKQAALEVIFPSSVDRIVTAQNIHDYNLVVYMQFYHTTFLWTGDVEVSGEYEILDTYPHLQADLIKVAHHGSITSTSDEWLDRLRPKLAIISVGANNWYGHPHPDVLKRLEQRDIPVFRTDQHGGIMIQVNQQGTRLIPTMITK